MRRIDNAGFTLLELLIAMTLLGLVLVMLYSGFNIGLRSWDKGEAVAEQLNQIRLTQEFLRRQLRQSVTVFRTDAREGRKIYFTGEPLQIGWVAPMLRYLGLGGLYYLQLEWVKNTESGQLVLRWIPYNPTDEDDLIDDDDVEQTVLLDGVEDFRLEYFGGGRTR